MVLGSPASCRHLLRMPANRWARESGRTLALQEPQLTSIKPYKPRLVSVMRAGLCSYLSPVFRAHNRQKKWQLSAPMKPPSGGLIISYSSQMTLNYLSRYRQVTCLRFPLMVFQSDVHLDRDTGLAKIADPSNANALVIRIFLDPFRHNGMRVED